MTPRPRPTVWPIPMVLIALGFAGPVSAAPPAGEDVYNYPPSAPRTAAWPDAAVVMREHRVTDPGMAQQTAATLLVPQDWTVSGGLTRPDPRLSNMPVLVDLKVTAPDGRQAHLYPVLTFEWVPSVPAPPFTVTASGNFYHPPPDSLGRFLLGLAQADPQPGVTDLRLTVDEPAEQLTAEVRRAAAPFYQLVQQMNQGGGHGVSTQFDTQATRVVFNYRENGKPFEETFFICWQYFVTIMNGEVFSGSWAITSMRSSRGTPGQTAATYLRDPVLTAIFQSLRTDPQWQAQMDRYWASLTAARAQGNQYAAEQARKRAEVSRQTSEYIADSMNETYRYGQALTERQNERFADHMLDQTKYDTVDGQTVKLPAYYDHVYTDGDGNYLLHNDVTWDPNKNRSVNEKPWQRIEKSD